MIADNGIFNFFSSGTWAVIRNLTLFFVAVFWLATAFWVYKGRAPADRGPVARRDGDRPRAHPALHRPADLHALPPAQYLEDVREPRLEIKAMEERLSRREMHCPVCRAEVDPAF